MGSFLFAAIIITFKYKSQSVLIGNYIPLHLWPLYGILRGFKFSHIIYPIKP